MKKSVILLLILGIFSIAPSLSAESVTVSYVDGILEVKGDDGWSEVYIGDSMLVDAVLKLGEDSIAQLEASNISLTLSSSGIYRLNKLLRERQQMKSWDIASIVGAKISSVLNPKRKPATAAMGVRGAKADNDREVEWVEEADDYLAEGKSLLEKKEYDRSIQILQEGLRDADEEVKPQYFFFLGVANVQNGRPYIALKYFNRIKLDRYFDYFDTYVVLKGKLLIESFAFREALRLFNFYLKEAPQGSAIQEVYFLRAVALKNLGDNNGAVSSLKKAYRINPSTEIGKKAKKILASEF